MKQIVLGSDVGGTHTDLLLLGVNGNILDATKVPTRPDSPMEGVIQGIREINSPEKINVHVNGTTIATNALLQHKFPKVALLTTKGFRDVLIIRRETKENIYDLFWDKPEPLVPRRHTYEIEGRLDFQGKVIKPLNLGNIPTVVEQLKKEKIVNIAVCLIHAYVNDRHEIEVRNKLNELYPEARVVLSSEVWPHWREFERTYNTVLTAGLGTIISNYAQSLLDTVEGKNEEKAVFIMQANGGIIGARQVGRRPILTLTSGTAAGAIGGAYLAEQSGFKKVITFDIGGTSTDMTIIENGKPLMTAELFLEWEGTLGFSAIDVHSIGAGGGSIGWLDEVGALHVGPLSAGADPGPACYDKGGKEPTVTDAHVHLGYLDPGMFLGGKAGLNAHRAQEALENLGKKTELNSKELALGILKIVNSNMLNGLRCVTIEKGYDPREFALVCFGGAGPLHAAAMIKELGVKKALIPIYPGNVSAFGMIAARPMAESSRTVYMALSSIDKKMLNEIFDSLKPIAIRQLEISGIPSDQLEVVYSLDMRYEGQTYEINVLLGSQTMIQKDNMQKIIADLFHSEHKKRYTYSRPEESIMIINARVQVSGIVRRLILEMSEIKSSAVSQKAQASKRPVYFEVNGKPYKVTAAVYRRSALNYGNRIYGPSIIEEAGSTTLIPEGFCVAVDKFHNMVMEEIS